MGKGRGKKRRREGEKKGKGRGSESEENRKEREREKGRLGNEVSGDFIHPWIKIKIRIKIGCYLRQQKTNERLWSERHSMIV